MNAKGLLVGLVRLDLVWVLEDAGLRLCVEQAATYGMPFKLGSLRLSMSPLLTDGGTSISHS